MGSGARECGKKGRNNGNRNKERERGEERERENAQASEIGAVRRTRSRINDKARGELRTG
jgi:hypothetical protein